MIDVLCNVCKSFNIKTRKQKKITLPPKSNNNLKGYNRKVTYGYCYNEHHCLDCNNIWEGNKVSL